MKAAVVHTVGQPPRFDEFPDPVPAEGEALVTVRAAALPRYVKMAIDKPIYSGGRETPYVCGLEGIGTLGDGSRVIFYAPKPPYGALAQYVAVQPAVCIPVPDGIDDAVAASLSNPGLTNLFALGKAGAVEEGETVLVLGATGFAGKLAVQMAKTIYKAGRVVAAGRDEQVLEALTELGADATIQLDQSDDDLAKAFTRELGDGYDVIVDYLWGHPAEVLLGSLPRYFMPPKALRYVQLGSMAGETVSIEADTVRRAGVSLLPASVMGKNPAEGLEFMNRSYKDLLEYVRSGQLRVDIEQVPLSDIEAAWPRIETMRGRRLVVTP